MGCVGPLDCALEWLNEVDENYGSTSNVGRTDELQNPSCGTDTVAENPPLILIWWQDRGHADESDYHKATFASLEEAELALQMVEQDITCNGIIPCWREGRADPRWDFLPF